LKDWQIKVIKNYEAKGGRFSTKSDVQKMYGISAADYARLEPWISLPDTVAFQGPATSYNKYRGEVVELNSADSAGLLKLPGVGPYMASNIIRYRNKLGGYTHTGQLLEVYRMQPETFAKISDRIRIDTLLVVPGVKINTSDFFLLLKHPYISKPLAYSITAHRQRYGKFRTIDDFRKVEGVNDSIWLILRPYLNCEMQ
jgi:DNA uptake protein ComE-like DNA-binding protein